MNADLRDDLDRAIDEALAAAVAGEPRRVDAASVRQALAQQGRSPVPLWLGLAAALVIAGGGVVFLRGVEEPRSLTEASMPVASDSPAETHLAAAPDPLPNAAISDEASRVVVARRPRSRPLEGAPELSPDLVTEPPYEGLPRLIVAPLDLPDSLSPRELQDRALVIPAIEITPLTLAGLSNEPER